MDNKAWFIDYKHDDWEHCYIVIHAPDKTEAKKILKRHVSMFSNVSTLSINRITPWNKENVPDDWKELKEDEVNE